MLKKIIFQWVLIALLVLAQAGMLTHEISHYVKQRSSALTITPLQNLAGISHHSLSASTQDPSTHRLATVLSVAQESSQTSDEAPANPHGPRQPSEICLQCLSFAQIAIAVLLVLIVLLRLQPPAVSHFRHVVRRVADIIAAAYCARAPPLFISTRP